MKTTRRDSKSGHLYSCPDGVERRGVTTYLSSMSKPALIPWAAKEERLLVLKVAAQIYAEAYNTNNGHVLPGFQEAVLERLGKERQHEKLLRQAGDFGKLLHDRIEHDLAVELHGVAQGPEPPLPPEAQWALDAFREWRVAAKFVPVLVEEMVWSSANDYAGTIDAFGTIEHEGQTLAVVADWKTSSGIYLEHAVQIAAYREALAENGAERLSPYGPVHGLVVKIPKVVGQERPEPHFIESAELDKYFQVFLHAKAMWHAMDTWEKANKRPRSPGRAAILPPQAPPGPEPFLTEQKGNTQ